MSDTNYLDAESSLTPSAEGMVSGQALAIRLLVFDLDGTLIDSSADLCRSVNAALRHVGRESLASAQIAGFIGDGAAMLMRRALAASAEQESRDAPVPQAMFQESFQYFLDYYRVHKLDETLPYPGVVEALRSIRTRYPLLPMAILTNKPVRPSREICAALGLAPFFFAIYGGDSFAKKPDPEGLLFIMAQANSIRGAAHAETSEITPNNVVMIGDSDIDITTAKRCRVRSLGCGYGLAREALEASSPDYMVESAAEWAAVLGL